jgi:cytochrome c oxidase assembly factor CtaG
VAASVGPYAWDPHLITWAVLVLGGVTVVVGHRRLAGSAPLPIPWTPRQIRQLAGAWVAAAVALTWPVADLAAHWSLIALVTQRLILLLAVAPLLLLGLPYDIVQWMTRPRAVDAVLTRLSRPPVAIVVVTVLAVGSMVPVLVHLQSTSPLARAIEDAVMVLAGLVLWIPVLGHIPGIVRPRPVVRFGYLVAQAVTPAFLSFIYIFSRHPLYPGFAGSKAATGLQPLNDQQVAGFVSKLTMLAVLLTVGGVVLARTQATDEDLGEEDPLEWADVEREFERADRRSSRVTPDGPEVEATGPTDPSDLPDDHRPER